MTQTTLTFLCDSPIARSSDPATSHEAAADVAGKLGLLQSRLAGVIGSSGPMTALEAAVECERLFGGLAESYRKRATECQRRGAISVAGVRVCRITGKNAMAYSGPLPAESK